MGLLLSLLFGPKRRRPIPPRNERVVVITGCDSGFGFEVALQLDRAGYILVPTCLTEDGYRNLQAKLTNPRSIVVRADVTNEQNVADLAKTVEQAFPQGIWCLVNNAGVYAMSLVELAPMSQFRRMMEINFFGVVSVTKALLPSLRKSQGRIVQLSSVAGTFAAPDLSAYCASKFALDAFSDALRREMLPFGVDVILVKPYYSKTNLMNNALNDRDRVWGAASEQLKQVYDEQFMQNTRKEYEKEFNLAIDPSKVVEVIISAIDGKNPAVHNVVGRLGKILYWFEYFMPTRMYDSVLYRALGGFVPMGAGK